MRRFLTDYPEFVVQAAHALWQLSGIPNQNRESLWGCACPPHTGFRPALSLMMTLYNSSLIKSKPGRAYESPWGSADS